MSTAEVTENTVIRAAELPVNRCLNMPWGEFCKLMHSCWAQSTALSNWAVQQLVRNDVVRTPDMAKLPPVPLCPCPKCTRPKKRGKNKGHPRTQGIDLYAHLQGSDLRPFWTGACVQASSILRLAEARYKALRFRVIWRRDALPPLFKYPTPLPVHSQAWTPRFQDGKPVLDIALPGGRVSLEMRCGPEFGRQIAAFRSLVEGKAKKRALEIRGQLTSSSNGRQTLEYREPGGASDRQHFRILCKLVLSSEPVVREADRILTLCTDPNALWVAELDGRRAWVLNADHVRRACQWQEAHRLLLQRWGEDGKAERRSDPNRRRQFQASRERQCLKHQRRMDSWIKESVSHLLRFCLRQRVGVVAYDSRDQGFMPCFPWYKLNARLTDALLAEGIKRAEEPIDSRPPVTSALG